MSAWAEVLIAAAIAATAFTAVFALCVARENYGLLDVAWSYGVAVLAPFYAVGAAAPGARTWIMTAVGAAWSLRLGTHILRRVLAHHPVEDPRYATLRARWPGRFRFWLFFQLQAALAVVFSLPFLLVARDQSGAWHVTDIVGLAIAAMAITGEATADAQLDAFKRDRSNRGRVCDVGLWRYSRHPNYFFEWAFWCGIALAAFSAPWGWVALACPALMLHFLLRVTGIPLAEAQSLASRGDAYRAYQRATSAFIPLPPRP